MLVFVPVYRNLRDVFASSIGDVICDLLTGIFTGRKHTVNLFLLMTEKEKSLSLSNDGQELLNYYNMLPEREQMKLVGRAAGMVDMCEERVNEKSKKTDTMPTIEVKHSYYKVSAGTGCYLVDSDSWDTISVPAASEARRADFCLTISGDSMEPIYYNGDIVFVKSQPSVELNRHVHD